MKKLLTYSAFSALFLWGCNSESPTQTASGPGTPTAVSGQRTLSQLKLDGGMVTFYANGDNMVMMESHAPGAPSLLGEKYQGMTLAEIYHALAPMEAIPSELQASTERFQALADGVVPAEENPATAVGENAITDVPAPLAKAADLNDSWFSNNYCQWNSFYNGYKTCLLNRTPERGLSTDWVTSTAARSYVYVYPYKGGQIHLNGKIDGSNILDVDLLSGSVYSYYMYSGHSVFGCRINKTHKWTITHTSGCGWHWSYAANLDC
ncbi:MAG: hypothetical protein ABI036_20180 [Fibrobacteria bacterium]